MATDGNKISVLTENDVNWSELVAPAPMGIAVLSQLMISASQMPTDLPIIRPNDKNQSINQTQMFLIKYPNSFRTTLVQIVNEAYNAFMKAHTNMEKIQFQTAQVPDYVEECVKLMQSDNKVVKKKFLDRRLENIEKIAVNGENLSREVCNAFVLLMQLIQQVLLAITDSRGAKEEEMKNILKDTETRKIEFIKQQKTNLEKEEDDARELLSKGKKYLMEEHNRNKGFFEYIFGGKKEKIAVFERTVKDAEERLKKAKQDQVDACDECTESLEKMQIDFKKNISTNEMIQILKDGMKQLGKLQENWFGMTLYFQSINTYIADMKTKQSDFVEDAKDAPQEDHFFIDFTMNNTLKKLLKSSIKSHRTAATYVKVSNNYIMEPLRKMHGMLSIKPAEKKQAQDELIDSSKRAFEGIKVMFIENQKHEMSEMENYH